MKKIFFALILMFFALSSFGIVIDKTKDGSIRELVVKTGLI